MTFVGMCSTMAIQEDLGRFLNAGYLIAF